MVKAELEQLVGKDEKILWSGAPKRSAYLWRSFVNLLLPIALVWCCIDIPLFIATVVSPEASGASAPDAAAQTAQKSPINASRIIRSPFC